MYADFITSLRRRIEGLGYEALSIGPLRFTLDPVVKTISQEIYLVGAEESLVRLEYNQETKEIHVTDSISKEINELTTKDHHEAIEYIMGLLDEVKDYFQEVQSLIKHGEF